MHFGLLFPNRVQTTFYAFSHASGPSDTNNRNGKAFQFVTMTRCHTILCIGTIGQNTPFGTHVDTNVFTRFANAIAKDFHGVITQQCHKTNKIANALAIAHVVIFSMQKTQSATQFNDSYSNRNVTILMIPTANTEIALRFFPEVQITRMEMMYREISENATIFSGSRKQTHLNDPANLIKNVLDLNFLQFAHNQIYLVIFIVVE